MFRGFKSHTYFHIERLEMPLYVFECKKCRHKSERLLKLDERDKAIVCGKCGSDAIRVTAQTAPPRFKGDGWTQKVY